MMLSIIQFGKNRPERRYPFDPQAAFRVAWLYLAHTNASPGPFSSQPRGKRAFRHRSAGASGKLDDPTFHGGLFVNIESCAQGGAYPVHNFVHLVELAQKRDSKTIAVAAAAQEAVLLAVNEAEEWGIVDVILIDIDDQLPSMCVAIA